MMYLPFVDEKQRLRWMVNGFIIDEMLASALEPDQLIETVPMGPAAGLHITFKIRPSIVQLEV